MIKLIDISKIFFVLTLLSNAVFAEETWLKKLNSKDNIIQKNLRWKAIGGQADLRFIYEKLAILNINIIPAPQYPNKHWSANHLVLPINKLSSLELQVPYGVITKVTSGALKINANINLSHKKQTLNISDLILKPTKIINSGDLVNFIVMDNKGRDLFTASSIHIQLDVKNKLLKMSNIDLIATANLAKLLNAPQLKNQVVAQLHTYSHLEIPATAKTTATNPSLLCASNPVWPPDGEVDVLLMNLNNISYLYDVGTDKVVIAPSARLKNIGTADVAWYWKFTGSFLPYNNDQHPYLNWSIYREIDNRFEQIGLSGVKHAFFTINSVCSCPGGQVLGLDCEDVYGLTNNDDSEHLGPRDEINAFTGVWNNCGSFFDPLPCTGSQVNQSSQLGQNRMLINKSDLTDAGNTQMFFQAWYVIRDDINIFNSMGYKPIAPTPSGAGWNINEGNASSFKNGAALDNYVTPNSISTLQASQTITTSEGHFTVAVKVIDLGTGLFRYNYAIENYDFDPKFINYHIPMPDSIQFTNGVFVDLEQGTANSWQFSRSNNTLNITGNAANQQGWGELYSFSFTSNTAPARGKITIDAATPVLNPSVVANTLIPDTLFNSGFE